MGGRMVNTMFWFVGASSELSIVNSYRSRRRQARTTPYQTKPITVPRTIASGGGTLKCMPPTYVVAMMTTHQGSRPKLPPSCTSLSRYPISKSLYTAVKTSPTAVAWMPLSPAFTACMPRTVDQSPMKPVCSHRPGVKIAR